MERRNFYLLPLCTLTFLPLRVRFLPACLPVYSCFAEAQEGRECLPLLLTAVPCWLVCPREELCCRAFWASEGWSVWPTGVLKESLYQNVKCSLPAMFNSAKFFPNVVKAYSRDCSYCTVFDMVLQRLKQNICLNNWTVKLFSLFPSQTEPVLTNVFKK